MDVAIQLEGQSGISWDRWRNLVPVIEDLGFAAIFRSDHFVNAQAPDLPSLEAWTSLTWLADHTSRIKFGPLVSPISFREPVMLARMAAAVAELSGGRLILGIGTGWSEREHEMFGYDLLTVGERIDRFVEGLDIVTGLLRGDGPLTYEGQYFQVSEAELLPRLDPAHQPKLLIPGRGTKRTLPLVAERADIWNTLFVDVERFRELSSVLDGMLDDIGRPRDEVQRTVMVGVDVGRTRQEVESKLAARAWADAWRGPGLVSGTPEDIREQLALWAAAGADMVILQWLDYDDVAGLEILAEAL